MEPINGLSNILEVLRRQISDNAQRLDKTGKTGSYRTAENASTSGAASPKELRALIYERLKGMNSNEAQYKHKAKRLFLESVVTWEFGGDIVRDQNFDDMLNSIQDAIDSNAETKVMFDRVIGELSARHDP